MKKDIAPEVLAFLKALPNMSCTEGHKDTFTKEDEARIKVMLNNATDLQAQNERSALKRYILTQDLNDNIEISDADREAMIKYLRKYAPEFYQFLIQK